MRNIPAFAAVKEQSGDAFIHLLEIEYSPGEFVRYARFNITVVLEGNAFTPFPMSKPKRSQSTTGEIPAYDIAVSGVGRELASILELYDIELRPGRAIRVHPSSGVFDNPDVKLATTLTISDPTAKDESPFTIVSARIRGRDAIITVTPVAFNPLGIFLPRKKVSGKDFPGVLGAANAYL